MKNVADIIRNSVLFGEVAGSIRYVMSTNFIIFINSTIDQLNQINTRHNTDIVKLALMKEHCDLDGKIVESRDNNIDGIDFSIIIFNKMICKFSRVPLNKAIDESIKMFRYGTIKGRRKLIAEPNVNYFIDYCSTLIASAKYFGGSFIDMIYEMNTEHPSSSVNNITTFAFLNIMLSMNNGFLDSGLTHLEIPTIQDIIDMIRKMISRLQASDYINPEILEGWLDLLHEVEVITKSKWLN